MSCRLHPSCTNECKQIGEDLELIEQTRSHAFLHDDIFVAMDSGNFASNVSEKRQLRPSQSIFHKLV